MNSATFSSFFSNYDIDFDANTSFTAPIIANISSTDNISSIALVSCDNIYPDQNTRIATIIEKDLLLVFDGKSYNGVFNTDGILPKYVFPASLIEAVFFK